MLSVSFSCFGLVLFRDLWTDALVGATGDFIAEEVRSGVTVRPVNTYSCKKENHTEGMNRQQREILPISVY